MNPPSNSASQKSVENPAAEADKPVETNPVRLAVLIGVMVLGLGALGVGKFVFDPDVQAKSEALEKEADKLNSGALVKESEPGKVAEGAKTDRKIYLSSDEVQKVLGRGPTKRVVIKNEAGKDHFVKEYYCWWGPLPIPSCYITVVYSDVEGKRYKTHIPNGEPEETDLPPDEAKLKRQAEQANKDNANTPQMKVPDLSGGPSSVPGEPGKSESPAEEKKEEPAKKDSSSEEPEKNEAGTKSEM